MTDTDNEYASFSHSEIKEAFEYARNHPVYARFVPPPDQLYLDQFLYRAIGIAVAQRRTEDTQVMSLTGAMVRRYVPDVNKENAELGKAYKGLASFTFNNRKRRKRKAKPAAARRAKQYEEAGQFRLPKL